MANYTGLPGLPGVDTSGNPLNSYRYSNQYLNSFMDKAEEVENKKKILRNKALRNSQLNLDVDDDYVPYSLRISSMNFLDASDLLLSTRNAANALNLRKGLRDINDLQQSKENLDNVARLRGWLDNKETEQYDSYTYDDFLKEYGDKVKDANDDVKIGVYNNVKAYKALGKDKYDKLETPENRLNYLNNFKAGLLVYNRFKNSDLETLNRIMNLSDISIRELNKSDYKSKEELKKEKATDYLNNDEYDTRTEAYKNRNKKPENLNWYDSIINGVNELSKGNTAERTSYVAAYIPTAITNWAVNLVRDKLFSNKQERNDAILDVIEKTDLETKKRVLQPIIDEAVNDTLNKIGNNKISEKEVIEDIDKVLSMSNYYNVWKNSSELEKYNLKDKLELYYTYRALSDLYGEFQAATLLNNAIQDRIAENQSNWAAILNNTKNVFVGGVANLMQKGLALEAVLYGIEDSITGTHNLELFLQGKNPDGTDRKYYYDPNYWNSVDFANSFDPDKVQLFRKYGTTEYNNVYKVGNVADFFSNQTLGEAFKMTKFLWSDYLAVRALSGFGKLASATAGAKYVDEAGRSISVWKALENSKAVMDLFSSSAISKSVNWAMSANAVLGGAGGIAMSYAKNVYDDTLSDLNTRIDDTVDKDVEEYYNQYLNSEEFEKDISNITRGKIKNFSSGDMGNASLDRETTELINLYLAAKKQAIRNQVEQNHSIERDLAIDAATRAFKSDALIEEFRYSYSNLLFKNWLFDKGTKLALHNENSLLRASFNKGKLGITKASKFNNRAYKIARDFAGGGWSNYMDDNTTLFAKAFGINSYNNYLELINNPTSHVNSNDILDYLIKGINNIEAGVDAVLEHALDRLALYDGWIGALGSGLLLGFGPAFMSSKARKEARFGVELDQNGKITRPLSWNERISRWIFNPLLYEMNSADEEEANLQKGLDVINNVISNNVEALEDNGTYKSILNLIATAKQTGNEQSLRTAENTLHYTIALDLRRYRNSSNKGERAIYDTAIDALEKISNETLEDEDKQFLIDLYLALDTNSGLDEDIALLRLVKNATDILETMELIDKIEETVNNTESLKSLSPAAKLQYVYTTFTNDNLQKRISSIEKDIRAVEEPTQSNITDIFEKGLTKGAASSRVKAQERHIKLLEELRDVIQALLDKYLEQLDNATTKSEKRFIQAQMLILTILKKSNEEALTLAHLAMGAVTNLAKIALYNEEATLQYSESGAETLNNYYTAEEILSMSPVMRAEMLNADNLNDFTTELQAEIKKAIDILNSKDTGLIKAVLDLVGLVQAVEENNTTLSKIRENPELATMYAKNISASRKNAMRSLYIQRSKEEAMKELENETDDNLLVQKAKLFTPIALEAYLEDHPELKYLLKPIILVTRAYSSIARLIYKAFEDKAMRLVYYKSIGKLIVKANTTEEIADILRGAIKSDKLTENDREIYSNFLRALEAEHLIGMASIPQVDILEAAETTTLSNEHTTQLLIEASIPAPTPIEVQEETPQQSSLSSTPTINDLLEPELIPTTPPKNPNDNLEGATIEKEEGKEEEHKEEEHKEEDKLEAITQTPATQEPVLREALSSIAHMNTTYNGTDLLLSSDGVHLERLAPDSKAYEYTTIYDIPEEEYNYLLSKTLITTPFGLHIGDNVGRNDLGKHRNNDVIIADITKDDDGNTIVTLGYHPGDANAPLIVNKDTVYKTKIKSKQQRKNYDEGDVAIKKLIYKSDGTITAEAIGIGELFFKKDPLTYVPKVKETEVTLEKTEAKLEETSTTLTETPVELPTLLSTLQTTLTTTLEASLETTVLQTPTLETPLLPINEPQSALSTPVFDNITIDDLGLIHETPLDVVTTTATDYVLGDTLLDRIAEYESLMIDTTALIGNTFYEYTIPRKNKDIATLRQGQSDTDLLSSYLNWIHQEGWLILEIIDNELYAISLLNPEIQLMSVLPLINSTKDNTVSHVLFNVIEYTNDVAKIHREERGGVIESNGKKYLVIGTFGYNGSVQLQRFFKILDLIIGNARNHTASRRKAYFDKNPNERFYVDPKFKTRIKYIGGGGKVIMTPKDTTKPERGRTLGSLLNSGDISRNPYGLSLWNISFGILEGGVFKAINYTKDGRYLEPTNTDFSLGSVFIYVPSSNGYFVPIALVQPKLSDVIEGSLLQLILDNLFKLIASPVLADRWKAIKSLYNYILIGQDTDFNILVGNEKYNTVTIEKRGVREVYNLDDPSVNSEDIINSIKNFSNNIVIKLSRKILEDNTMKKIYDEGGVLLTDAAKLGTMVASYTVHAIDPVTGEYTEGPQFTGAGIEEYNTNIPEVTIDGTKRYHKYSTGWTSPTGEEITNHLIIKLLDYNLAIKSRLLNPVQDPVYTNGNQELYIISEDANNPILVLRNNVNNRITELANSKEILDYLNAKKEATLREEAAKLVIEKSPILDTEPNLGNGEHMERGGILLDVDLWGDSLLDDSLLEDNKLEITTTLTTSNFNVETPTQSFDLLNQQLEQHSLEHFLNDLDNVDKVINAVNTALGTTFNDDTTINEIKQALIDKGITVENIDNIDDWINNLNCH